MDIIAFPAWAASSPSIAMAAMLGRSLRDKYCADDDFTVAYRAVGGADEDEGSDLARGNTEDVDGGGYLGRRASRSQTRDHRRVAFDRHRARLMTKTNRGLDDLSTSSSSSASSSGSASDEELDSTQVVPRQHGARRHSGVVEDANEDDDDDDDDALVTAASVSANSEYDPLVRPRRLRPCTSTRWDEAEGAGVSLRTPLAALAPADESDWRNTSAAEEAHTRAASDFLHNPYVQRLLRLSRIESFTEDAKGTAGADAETHTPAGPTTADPRRVTSKDAVGILALFAFAVECRPLPRSVTRGFYAIAGSAYTAMLSQLRGGLLAFNADFDVEGFTAALVACGLKMRVYHDGHGDGGEREDGWSAGVSSIGASHSNAVPSPAVSPSAAREEASGVEEGISSPVSGRATPQAAAGGGRSTSIGGLSHHSKIGGVPGFDAKLIDAAIVHCIPDTIDACAKDMVALGALRGIACTYSRHPLYLSSDLVVLLHNLTDSFATSSHRRDLSYKKLLSYLLEAMSCSQSIDYTRTNNWITAIIQETYVVRGLFQREVLHARVVAATLTLLIRQYQEMAAKYAATCDTVDGLPDFSEGNELIELVWRALQDTLQGWEEAPPEKMQTLYGANLRVVVQSLLRVEVERLRCYHVITCASTAYHNQLLASHASNHRGSLCEPSTILPSSADLSCASPVKRKGKAAADADGGADGDTDFTVYTPSDEEEVLRVRILSNVVRFLLLPTSVLNVIPDADTAQSLRRSLVAQCTHVITTVAATEFTRRTNSAVTAAGATDATPSVSPVAARTSTAAALHARTMSIGDGGAARAAMGDAVGVRQRARFSNGYYRKLESIVHELIRILVKKDGTHGDGSEAVQAEAAGACLQSFCASDSHLRSFAVSEVTDTVVGMAGVANESSDAEVARNLAPCFAVLCNIVVSTHYSLTRSLPRSELARYAQLLCDTYVDSLRQHLAKRHGSSTGAGGEADGRKGAKGLPTAVMRVASDAFWDLVVCLHERLRVLSRDAVRLARSHQEASVHQSPAMRGALGGLLRRHAARERQQYVRMLNSQNVSLRMLIMTAMRCVLGVAWPGSGVLYQRLDHAGAKSGQSGGTAWSGERAPSAATEPSVMAGTAITCIAPFLQPLCLLMNLSTLFPINSLRNKGLAAHAEHGRFLLMDEYREQYLMYYSYRPTTKVDDGEEVTVDAVDDNDALLDSSESHYSLSEFRSFWFLLTYYGFTSEALALASAKLHRDSDAGRYYAGEPHLDATQSKTIREIAASAAPFMQMRSSDIHGAVADIAALFRYIGKTPPAAARGNGGLKTRLVRSMRGLCGEDSHWEKLEAAELFLLRALTDLEMLRASNGSIANLTFYHHFDLREFVASPAIRQVIERVVSTVCAQYLATLRTFLPRTTYQLVTKDIHQLVLLLSFSLTSVRTSARQVLFMIVDAFPVFAAYASGLQLLWTVINVLETAGATQVEAFCRRMHYNAIPAVAADASSDDRRDQVRALVEVAEQWADKSRHTAPLVLFQAAAKFIVGQSVMGAAGVTTVAGAGTSGALTAPGQLLGSRLAIRAVASDPAITSGRVFNASTANAADGSKMSSAEAPARSHAGHGVLALGSSTDTPNFAQVLIKYSNAQGQVLSAVRVSAFAAVENMVLTMLRSSIHNSALSSPYTRRRAALPPVTDASQERGKDTKATAAIRALGSGVAQAGNAVSRLYEADSLLCSSVALLTTGYTSPGGTMELLRYLVQGPVHVFATDYIRTAVGCWGWLLTSDRSRFMVPLLQQLAEGVQWTVSQGLGLFDGARPSQNNQVQTGDDGLDSPHGSPSLPSDYSYASPHKIIFGFLADTYVDPGSPWALDPAVMLSLYNLLTSMVQYPSRLSLKDASFAETMRLALLAGHVCRHLHLVNSRRQKSGQTVVIPYTSIAALRHRWYVCLLQWFRKQPASWYFAMEPALGLQEMAVLESLVRLLREEESMIGRNSLGFIDFSPGVRVQGGGKGPGPVNVWGAASVVRLSIEKLYEKAGDSQDDAEAGMSRLIKQEQARLQDLLRLMRVLVEHEIVRLGVWRTPRRSLNVPDPLAELDSSAWTTLVDAAARADPAVMVAMATRFASYAVVPLTAAKHVVREPERFASIPEAVDLYITKEVLAAGAPQLYLFTNCTIIQALRFLDSRYATYPQVASYAIRSLLSQKSEYLIFYLPQLLQVLASDGSGSIQAFLLRTARKSAMFCHQLLWSLQTEGEGASTLAQTCKALEARIKDGFDDAQKAFYTGEFDYTALVTSMSGELMSTEKPQRKPKLRQRLLDAEFHDPIKRAHLYLPTDPEYRIVGVIPKTAGAMQSAAKCPILVQFQCVRRDMEDMRPPVESAAEDGGSAKKPKANGAAVSRATSMAVVGPDGAPMDMSLVTVKACIFKMGDDCRQDQISLQLIGLMKRIMDAVGVPSYLYPYRVVTTGQDSGIIEVVPHSMSRNEIGKLVESNIAEFYVQTFGDPESVRFHRARDNFVKSVASYSVVSYILNIKDRHNGNIMIDSEGHLVHIDFGFLFDTSPGGDMNFESSPFKLTTEMVQLIGKDVGSWTNLRSPSLAKALIDEESYVYFKTLVNRCYLAVRQYAREICILVELMLRSGLPCFKPKQTIANLARRLAVGKTEIEAADFMRRRIHQSRQNIRTVLYDRYQKFAEGIEM